MYLHVSKIFLEGNLNHLIILVASGEEKWVAGRIYTQIHFVFLNTVSCVCYYLFHVNRCDIMIKNRIQSEVFMLQVCKLGRI